MSRDRWDRLFSDLDGQAAALADAERWAEVDDRIREEAGALTIAERLHAAAGKTVRFQCPGGVTVSGTVAGVGRDWVTVHEATGHETVIVLDTLLAAHCLPSGATKSSAWPVVDSRLSLRHAVRILIRDRSAVRVHLLDGAVVDGTLDRIGANFVEVAARARPDARRRDAVRSTTLINMGAVVAIRRERV
jgi:hypothetical protein